MTRLRLSPSGPTEPNPEFIDPNQNNDLVTPLPQTRSFGTVNTASTKTVSVTIDENKVYDITALAFADDVVGGVVYSKGIRARVFRRQGSAVPVVIFQQNLDATTEGLGFTFAGALAGADMVFTLTNASGNNNVPYALDLGYYVFEVL